MIYSTFADAASAERVGRTIVGERLAACVNILPQMTSIYRWQDAIETSCEVVAIAKTTAPLVPTLIARMRELHNYTTPCIVALAIQDGDADFLQWLSDATAR